MHHGLVVAVKKQKFSNESRQIKLIYKLNYQKILVKNFPSDYHHQFILIRFLSLSACVPMVGAQNVMLRQKKLPPFIRRNECLCALCSL